MGGFLLAADTYSNPHQRCSDLFLIADIIVFAVWWCSQLLRALRGICTGVGSMEIS
jgi:hypothetical protein